jgi:hypothetical protein
MDSSPAHVVSTFFPDNKFNYATKLMAEANRADGFKVISLGYANGWGGAGVAAKPGIDVLTLTGGSSNGVTDLQADIDEALAAGFRHYLTDAPITNINTFAKLHANLLDAAPPVWTSTYNVNAANSPVTAPAPRVGIQSAVPAAGSITVAWDVALDMNRVSYALYYQTTPFNFATDPNLSAATRVVLTPTVGTGYAQAWNNPNPNTALQSVYPHQQTITALATARTYYMVIRAFDSAGNEEKNQIFLSAAI